MYRAFASERTAPGLEWVEEERGSHFDVHKSRKKTNIEKTFGIDGVLQNTQEPLPGTLYIRVNIIIIIISSSNKNNSNIVQGSIIRTHRF